MQEAGTKLQTLGFRSKNGVVALDKNTLFEAKLALELSEKAEVCHVIFMNAMNFSDIVHVELRAESRFSESWAQEFNDFVKNFFIQNVIRRKIAPVVDISAQSKTKTAPQTTLNEK